MDENIDDIVRTVASMVRTTDQIFQPGFLGALKVHANSIDIKAVQELSRKLREVTQGQVSVNALVAMSFTMTQILRQCQVTPPTNPSNN